MARNRFTHRTAGASNNIAQLWIDAGGSPSVANTMAAIAMAESSGVVNQRGDYGIDGPGYTSFGLWQIHTPAWPQYDANRLMTDPLYNARAAVNVYRVQGFTAWSTYNSGAYLGFLGGAASDRYTGAGKTPITRPGGQQAGTQDPKIPTVATTIEQWTTAQDDANDPDIPGTIQTTGIISRIPIIGPILGNLPGVPGIIDHLPDPVSFFKDISSGVNTVGDFLKAIIWIVNPHNIVRLFETLIGLGLIVFGFQAAMQARGERLEGFQTSEGALTRSGLGRVSQELATTINRAVPEARTANLGRRVRRTSAPHRARRQALRLRYEREQTLRGKRQAGTK